MQKEECIRELEMREAYEQGRRAGSRVNYRESQAGQESQDREYIEEGYYYRKR